MQDLTTYALDVLTGWNTSNYAPQPALVNRNDSAFHANPPSGFSVGDQTQDFDFTLANLIAVSNAPERIQTPIGTGYKYEVEDAVNVTIQGADESQHGQVADHSDFLDLVDEARRLLQADREFPLNAGDEVYLSTQIDAETDTSSEYRDFYEYQFDLRLDGYEDL